MGYFNTFLILIQRIPLHKKNAIILRKKMTNYYAGTLKKSINKNYQLFIFFIIIIIIIIIIFFLR